MSAAAGRTGVRAGMSVPEARVYCAELDVREWDARAVTDAVLAVTGQLLQCSPQVTSAHGAPGTWWVGASGFDHVGGEAELGQLLLKTARAWHPDARVAIADSCVAARAATWAPQTTANVTIIPPGTCAHYLTPAPLGLVPMTEELREALQSLGLRTVGSLAALAPGDVERRWGAEGIAAWRLAHGDDPRRPGLVRTELARSASAELASATDNMAPLLFIIRSALNRLVQQLLNDGRAAASVSITLSLDARPQHTITREIRPARPLARVAPLFDQCRALLEKWTLEAPVFAVTVSIPATAPLTADQGDLLVPSWRDAAATVDAVFVRLRAALETQGVNDVVVHPTFGNAHRPELAGQWEPADALRLAELGSTRDLQRARAGQTAEVPALRGSTDSIAAADAPTATTTATTTSIAESTATRADATGTTVATETTASATSEPAVTTAGLTADTSVSTASEMAGGDVAETPATAVPSVEKSPMLTVVSGMASVPRRTGPPLRVFGASAGTSANTSPPSRTAASLPMPASIAAPTLRSIGPARVMSGANNTSTSTLTPTPTPTVIPANAALRLLEKPERVTVQVMSGIPRQVTWRERRMSFVATFGPERLSGDWWRDDTFARDYWRCSVNGEGELLLYRDANGWFLQGWYD